MSFGTAFCHWCASILYLSDVTSFPSQTLLPQSLSFCFSFLSLLPLFLLFPPSPLFHIKLFFIEVHAAWNSIPPGTAGWNTRLFWAPAKQMLALGVPPETRLHAFLFFSLSLSLPLLLSCLIFFPVVLCLYLWLLYFSLSRHFLTVLLCLCVKGSFLVS